MLTFPGSFRLTSPVSLFEPEACFSVPNLPLAGRRDREG
jgi:hypothetical protein